MNKPLVSLTVICYKAEAFVREAIEGALSQTYSPLEIIFSDDCSPDRTFEIIQEAVKDYKGPHKIVLNRNERNMGIGAHVSKVWFEIAKGEWIIVSAGDDVSLPHRVETLMNYARPDVAAIHHQVIAIDENSQKIPKYSRSYTNTVIRETESVEEAIRKGKWLKGATMCLNRNMLLRYGPLNPDVVNEDTILAYRAAHYGDVLFLDSGLMKYRLHPNSWSETALRKDAGGFKNRIISLAKENLSICRQVLADSALIPMSDSLKKSLRKREIIARMDLFLFEKESFDVHFLSFPFFYMKALKRLIFKPYAIYRALTKRLSKGKGEKVNELYPNDAF